MRRCGECEYWQEHKGWTKVPGCVARHQEWIHDWAYHSAQRCTFYKPRKDEEKQP